MPSVYRDENTGLILTVQLGSTLCMSYSKLHMHAGKVHTRKSHITHKIVVIDSSFYDSCIT